MKTRSILLVLGTLGVLAATVAEANAVVCARGPYRAGCAGPRGAVGVGRYGAGAVARPYGYRGAVVRPYGYHPYGVYRRPLVN
jgi:hypothetical protein